MDTLLAVMALLDGQGEPMAGIEMSLDEAKARGGFAEPLSFARCVVRDWIWIDLVLDEQGLAAVQAAGQQPVMLYGTVMLDSAGRFDPGDWVRTTMLVTFSEGCLFCTRNSRYVLVGDGQRKSATFETVMALH